MDQATSQSASHVTSRVTAQEQPLIRLHHVRKTFGAATVLDGISIDVRKGEVICIIGPSGAGKSTLLRCINALVPIDSGSITVAGQEVNDPKLDKITLRRKVGIVFQQYNLLPALTTSLSRGAGANRRPSFSSQRSSRSRTFPGPCAST